MVEHIIIWTLKPELSDTEKAERKRLIKEGLEGLSGRIEGMKSIEVITDILPSSSGDLMLRCVFENEEALKGYSKNPLHNAAADERVRPFIADRKCVDYITHAARTL